MKALGMIEVYGYLTAVEALDSAVKTADVSLIEVTKVTGGLVCVMLSGEVAATKAAVDAAAASATRVGQVVAAHVIARPASDIDRMISGKKRDEREKPEDEKPETSNEIERNVSEKENQLTEEAMEKMTVVCLRSLAREIGIPSMTKPMIRFARKRELIDAILAHLKGVK